MSTLTYASQDTDYIASKIEQEIPSESSLNEALL